MRSSMPEFLLRGFVGLQLRLRKMRQGQTMTEYALLLASVATFVYVGYKNMGTKLTGVLNQVDNQL